MNHRERFLATLHFEPADRVPLIELGYWPQTVELWKSQGMVRSPNDPEREYPGLDAMRGEGIGVNLDMLPLFTKEVLKEEHDKQIVRDEHGVVSLVRKDGSSMPHFLEHPVKDRRDWERMKERFQPSPARYPLDWPCRIERLSNRQHVVGTGACITLSTFGFLREMLGLERVLYAFYDDPDLIRDMLEYNTNFLIAVLDRALSEVQLDYGRIWEDMAYKNGPLISPEMFREFCAPSYRKLTQFYRDHGITIVDLDCDGDCRPLIPIWLECGVTCIHPCEAQANVDVVELRRQFPRLGMQGGVDKGCVTLGPKAIDAELERKLPFMLARGGYIPYVDHLVPPTVSWQNFKYYRRRLKDFAEARGRCRSWRKR